MEKEGFEKYMFWGIVALLLVLSYYIVKRYIITIISSFILAYLLRPVYLRLRKRMSDRNSALVCIVFMGFIIFFPLLLIIGGVAQQAYTSLNQNDVQALLNKISQNEFLKNSGLDLNGLRQSGVNFIISTITSLVSYIPFLILALLIIFWGMYYFLVHWDEITVFLQQYLPFKNKDKIAKEIDQATHAIIRGTLIVAIVDFIIASVVFSALGVNAPLFYGALLGLFAFVPGIGTAGIWLPLGVIYIAMGNMVAGIGILVIGAIVIMIGIDTVLRSKLMGEGTQMNPLLMLIGVVGGVPLFGIVGVIVGPLILFYAIKIIQEKAR